jgi:hypothetical protein
LNDLSTKPLVIPGLSIISGLSVISGLCILALCLAGCVETTAQREPAPEVPKSSNMARREGVSPHGASVAVGQLQGLPGSESGRLSELFQSEASARDVNLTAPKNANYLVRGYLNATPAEGGATYAMVYDVYDAKKHRAQRIEDQVYVKGASPDIADDAALRQIASKGAEDLAAVLTNMPEAVAASASGPALDTSKPAAQSADEDGTTTIPGAVASRASASVPDKGRSVAASE